MLVQILSSNQMVAKIGKSSQNLAWLAWDLSKHSGAAY